MKPRHRVYIELQKSDGTIGILPVVPLDEILDSLLGKPENDVEQDQPEEDDG